MVECLALGCGEPEVYISERCGSPQVMKLENIQDLQWGRVVDETSEAEVTYTINGDVDTACCDELGRVNSWVHTLTILRDGELVWEGPIINKIEELDQVTIVARDVTAWFDVRTTHDLIDYTADSGTGPVDLSVIATAVITSALEPDDPCILEYLDIQESGYEGEKLLEPNEEYAGDVLRELARSGIDFTSLGRRIIIRGDIGGEPFITLTDDNFTQGLTLEQSGLEAATRWIVKGDGVKGIAGGIDPYYGLIEQIADESGIEDQTTANSAANSRLEATNPPPLYFGTGEDFGLDPNTPLCINDLIPGRLVTITSNRLCTPIRRVLRLLSVSVKWNDSGGEVVSVQFGPLGTLDSQSRDDN